MPFQLKIQKYRQIFLFNLIIESPMQISNYKLQIYFKAMTICQLNSKELNQTFTAFFHFLKLCNNSLKPQTNLNNFRIINLLKSSIFLWSSTMTSLDLEQKKKCVYQFFSWNKMLAHSLQWFLLKQTCQLKLLLRLLIL